MALPMVVAFNCTQPASLCPLPALCGLRRFWVMRHRPAHRALHPADRQPRQHPAAGCRFRRRIESIESGRGQYRRGPTATGQAQSCCLAFVGIAGNEGFNIGTLVSNKPLAKLQEARAFALLRAPVRQCAFGQPVFGGYFAGSENVACMNCRLRVVATHANRPLGVLRDAGGRVLEDSHMQQLE